MSDKPTTTVDLSWKGGFEFVSRDSYGHALVVHAPENEGEPFAGFMPGELLLTSLAGCSGIDVVNIMRRQRQEVTGLEIHVKGAQQSDPPWTWDEIELEYVIKGVGLKRRRRLREPFISPRPGTAPSARHSGQRPGLPAGFG